MSSEHKDGPGAGGAPGGTGARGVPGSEGTSEAPIASPSDDSEAVHQDESSAEEERNPFRVKRLGSPRDTSGDHSGGA